MSVDLAMQTNDVVKPPKFDGADLGRVVLVLQGGGALGAYQVGVYQALREVGAELDWVIGTSIGAINASIIAGNPAERRLAQLEEFWRRITFNAMAEFASQLPCVGQHAANAMTLATGIPGFFEPNPTAFLGTEVPLACEAAGYYSIKPLERTLTGLVDPALLNAGRPRATVGAANIRSGEMHYFDSRDTQLTIRHVIASGALPPAFPAVRIDGELYWDGGVLSNTPVEAVFDDNPRRSGLVFAVHMWKPNGPDPDSIARVVARQKDLQYSSRAVSHIARQKQIHKLRHIITELVARLPPGEAKTPEVRALRRLLKCSTERSSGALVPLTSCIQCKPIMLWRGQPRRGSY
jgi:NTE family protein